MALTIGEQVFAKLSADAMVAQLVGQRLFPDILPQGAALPAVVYQVIEERSQNTLSGLSSDDITSTTLQVNCYARPSAAGGGGYLQAHAVADAVEAVLGNLSDVGLSAWLQLRRDLYDNDTEYFRVSLDFSLWV